MAAVLGRVPFGERGGAVLRPGVGIDQHARRAVQPLADVEHRLVLKPVIAGVEIAIARLLGHAEALVIVELGHPRADRVAARQSWRDRRSVTSFCAVTQCAHPRILADVVLEPAIGIGDPLAELLLDHVAALRSPDRRSGRRRAGRRRRRGRAGTAGTSACGRAFLGRGDGGLAALCRRRKARKNRFYRADHFPLAKRGVRVLLLMALGGGVELVAGGRAAGDRWGLARRRPGRRLGPPHRPAARQQPRLGAMAPQLGVQRGPGALGGTAALEHDAAHEADRAAAAIGEDIGRRRCVKIRKSPAAISWRPSAVSTTSSPSMHQQHFVPVARIRFGRITLALAQRPEPQLGLAASPARCRAARAWLSGCGAAPGERSRSGGCRARPGGRIVSARLTPSAAASRSRLDRLTLASLALDRDDHPPADPRRSARAVWLRPALGRKPPDIAGDMREHVGPARSGLTVHYTAHNHCAVCRAFCARQGGVAP